MTNPAVPARAKRLRREQTDAERCLWHFIRARRLRGFKFRRQVWIGSYIADFVCVERRLIVEIDGAQHASMKEVDAMRTERLSDRGFRVVRFWNNDVLLRTEAVLAQLLLELEDPER